MITCNSCGELVQAGLLNCQQCGKPLSSANRGGIDSRKGARKQSELPTWLESLRVNERPNPPASGQALFSTADLIDEGALPGWMHAENTELMDKGNSGKYPAWRPNSMAAPDTGGGIVPARGFPASSLIDEQSLPSWVNGQQQNMQTATGAASVVPDTQKNFSAASLIQSDDLPDWMKSLPQSSQPAVPHNSVWGGEQPFDSQARFNSFTPNSAGVDLNSAPQSFSAGDLLDPQAMPGWMSERSYQPGQQVEVPPATPQDGQSRLSASSLLDVNSLPNWLREGEHVQSQPDQVRMSSPDQLMGQMPGASDRLTGASLIDMNALPDWLRSSQSQQQADLSSMGHVRPHSNGSISRVEGARVPSRPRGEVAPHEQSEVAANVFSSMLGVASGAPYFPSTGAQWNAPSQNTMGSSQGGQGMQPQPPAGAQWNASPQPAGLGGVPPAYGYNPAGYQGGYQGASFPGGPPVGGQPGMAQQPPVYRQGMPPEPSFSGQNPNTNAPGSKPAKRGFIETIRSWFS